MPDQVRRCDSRSDHRSCPVAAVACGAMRGEQAGAIGDRTGRIAHRRCRVGRRIRGDGEHPCAGHGRRHDTDQADRGRPPRAPARAGDQSSKAGDGDEHCRKQQPRNRRRFPRRCPAQRMRERPERRLMRGRHRDSQHADDSHHQQPGADLDQRVAPQRTQCRPIAGAKARRQDQPIDRGERKHRGEQRELREQQRAVAGAEQRRNAADQEPAVADAAQDQHAHACDRQTGKAPGRPCRVRRSIAPCRASRPAPAARPAMRPH